MGKYGSLDMTEAQLRSYHLYKELLTKEERSTRYRILRRFGWNYSMAQRWRDVSPRNFLLALNNRIEFKEWVQLIT